MRTKKAPVKKQLNIGDTVCISGDHPHAGRTGKIEGAYAFKFGAGNALKIDFPDGDGCFVFAGSGVNLIPVQMGQR